MTHPLPSSARHPPADGDAAALAPVVPLVRRLALPCALFALVLALAGCGTPVTRVILLPQPDHRPSAVVVTPTAGGQPVRVDQPFRQADVKAGDTRVSDLSEQQVRTQSPLLFDLMPAAAKDYTVLFDQGSVQFTKLSSAVLDEALRDAQSRPGGELTIIGHTDTKGSAAANLGLSLRRARAIESRFVAQGFPPSRISIEGRGQKELAVPTPDQRDEPRNRRVVIEVR